MEARLTEFAEVLRQNGVRVGTSEVLDAACAVAQVGVAERAVFQAALEATLVKREADVPTFERCFAFFFSGAARTFDAIERGLLERLREEGLLEGDELRMLLEQLPRLLPGLSPLAQAAAQGDRARLAQLFRAAALQLDLGRMESALQAGFFSRRLLGAAGLERARTDLQGMAEELGRRGLSAQGVEVVSRHLDGALRRLEEASRREMERQARARVGRGGERLEERPLSQLSRAELEQMEAAVRRLAERLKTRLVRRQRSRRKGALHVHRTLRRNLPWGAIPMVPQFRARRPQRPEVVVLCDVSDSVRATSRMMLLFMHTLQSLFARVRSFVFVSDVGEVTRHFRDAGVDEAVDLATAGRSVALHANSNYGRALGDFVRAQLGSISRRTTVMVIGDGRTNFHPPNAQALRELRRKARRLLWICPEPEGNWGVGDSEMPAYARECHQTVVVLSLSDLARVADLLLPV